MSNNIDHETISFNDNHSYSKIKDIYLKEYDLQKLPSIPTYSFHIKTNTPLIYVSNLNDVILDTYRKALLYIGKCHHDVPLNKNKLFISIFNNEINYTTREFGYIPKNMKFEYKKLIDMAFSASSFRTMCIKAEIAIYFYFKILSKLVETESEECLTEEDRIYLGGVTYAINRSLKHNDESIKMAVYVWELTTLMNVFGNLDYEFENTFCIPSHHVFQTTHRYNYITYFGEYDEYEEKNSIPIDSTVEVNLDEFDFYLHLSRVPRCETNIEYDYNNIFYNGIDTTSNEGIIMYDVRSNCTKCFNKYFKSALDMPDLNDQIKELLKICSYEEEYLVKPGDNYIQHKWEVINDIESFKSIIKVPNEFKQKMDECKNKLYLVIYDGNGLKVCDY